MPNSYHISGDKDELWSIVIKLWKSENKGLSWAGRIINFLMPMEKNADKFCGLNWETYALLQSLLAYTKPSLKTLLMSFWLEVISSIHIFLHTFRMLVIAGYVSSFVSIINCDWLCENPPCLHVLHRFTNNACKFSIDASNS